MNEGDKLEAIGKLSEVPALTFSYRLLHSTLFYALCSTCSLETLQKDFADDSNI